MVGLKQECRHGDGYEVDLGATASMANPLAREQVYDRASAVAVAAVWAREGLVKSTEAKTCCASG